MLKNKEQTVDLYLTSKDVCLLFYASDETSYKWICERIMITHRVEKRWIFFNQAEFNSPSLWGVCLKQNFSPAKKAWSSSVMPPMLGVGDRMNGREFFT